MTGCPIIDSDIAARKNGKRLPCERLSVENAKLRRVIESEIHCHSSGCKGCVAYRPTEDGWCDQQTWLEELGIEGHL